ncbi:MAG: arsenosugar biosynthesis radical SAM (seleno)protein ArsS [Planctomycetota bacterium]
MDSAQEAGLTKKMTPKTSLKHRGERLADPQQQLVVLSPMTASARFEKQLADTNQSPLCADEISILQVNVGKLCNMTCAHCHVDAGPDRREVMKKDVVEACIQVLAKHPQIRTLDLTGGAPEMNPYFRYMVEESTRLGRHVIDRCNLTILTMTGYKYLPEFLAKHKVEVVASLPCYLEENTDAQRGEGAYNASIEGLLLLNQLGYGVPGTGLTLTLVFNPVGQSLPPEQSSLQEAYRKELKARFGIVFNRLFTITNMPVSRYLDYLLRIGEYETYMQKLMDAFNPSAVEGLMCRNTVSVSWDGSLYDCDFNQMLDLKVKSKSLDIQDFDYQLLAKRRIITGQHCYGCTAGSGSSCQGSLA